MIRGGGWDFDAAAHLWRRAAFSASTEQVEETLRRGPADAVALLVDGPRSDPATDGLESIYATVLGTTSEDNMRAWIVTRRSRSNRIGSGMCQRYIPKRC